MKTVVQPFGYTVEFSSLDQVNRLHVIARQGQHVAHPDIPVWGKYKMNNTPEDALTLTLTTNNSRKCWSLAWRRVKQRRRYT
ncbi:unnamed protein product [Sphacelaria rigidula]